MYDIIVLNEKLLPELKDIAKDLGIKKTELMKKQDLIYKILDQQAISATTKTKHDKEKQASSVESEEDKKKKGRKPKFFERVALDKPAAEPTKEAIPVIEKPIVERAIEKPVEKEQIEKIHTDKPEFKPRVIKRIVPILDEIALPAIEFEQR